MTRIIITGEKRRIISKREKGRKPVINPRARLTAIPTVDTTISAGAVSDRQIIYTPMLKAKSKKDTVDRRLKYLFFIFHPLIFFYLPLIRGGGI
jgi:hypothetical protein